jgi:bacterioferritin-associated ferredoxin
MILCSCNVITTDSIRQYMESRANTRLPSVQEIMQKHGCSVECATCAYNIKVEIRKHYESLHR